VFFTSDNGAPDKPVTRFFQSNGHLRGHKGSVYEGGIRVPMIARWPGHIAAHATNSTPWYFADFLPTVARLAGLSSPPVDGQDISGLLLGNKLTVVDRPLYWEKPGKSLQQAVRWGRWKAVRSGLGAPLELYDLEEDLCESHDQAPRRREIVSQIENYLKTARTESPHWPTRPNP